MMLSNVKYTRVNTSNDNDDEADREETDLSFSEAMNSVGNGDEKVEMVTEHHVKSTSCQTIFSITVLILSYFILSIGVTFYQRMILKEHHFPFSIVIYHLFIKLVISCIIRIFYRLITGKQRVQLAFSTSLKKVAPTSFFSAIDIGFSQKGLQFFGVALYTMTKSTAIIFISMFAILFRLEKKSWSLGIIVVMISSGLFLFTWQSKEFQLLGFIFLLMASLASGIRWTLAQMIMQKSKLGLHNPIDMIYFMQGYMIISVLPLAFIFEGKSLWEHSKSLNTMDSFSIFMLWLKISTAAFLIFFMEISEFLVLTKTSSLTLSIAGVFKEICQLVLAVETRGDELSIANIIGLLLCLGGITSHVLHKYLLFIKSSKLNPGDSMNTSVRTSVQRTVKNGVKHQKAPLLESESDSEDIDEKTADIIFDNLKHRDERRIHQS